MLANTLTLRMNRLIKFYRTNKNDCPVKDFLDTLTDKEAAKVLAVFKTVENENLVSSQFFKKLKGYDIWEIRVKWSSKIFRFLCFFYKGNIVVLTHGFIKKDQKTPLREIKKAITYIKDFLGRNK